MLKMPVGLTTDRHFLFCILYHINDGLALKKNRSSEIIDDHHFLVGNWLRLKKPLIYEKLNPILS